MSPKKKSGWLVPLIFTLISASPAWGWTVNTLYATSGRGHSTLYALDGSGQATAVGRIGVKKITDIAFRGSVLYGITCDRLYTIDPDTGAGSLVGPLPFAHLNALAVDPITGAMYAAGADGVFARIDPVTGAATEIGSFGTLEGGRITSAGDLAFVPQGSQLYAAVNWEFHGRNTYLATIDPATGAATIIGSIGFDRVGGLAFNDGILYGVTDHKELLRLDPLTGRGQQIGKMRIRADGLTAAPVPVPGAIFLLGTGLVCLALRGRGRR